MAHLGPTIGGVEISPSNPPHPVTRIRPSLPDTSAPVRRPWGAVRPPATPNRPLGAVYRSECAVSRQDGCTNGKIHIFTICYFNNRRQQQRGRVKLGKTTRLSCLEWKV
jgi:hypothetical protein